MSADLSRGAFGPGVKPYTAADHSGWMGRNLPAGYPQAPAPAKMPQRPIARPAATPGGAQQTQAPGMLPPPPASGQARGVAINPGDITGRLARESRFNSNSSSDTTRRAVQDLSAADFAQNRANVNRGLESANAQIDMQGQSNRSAAYQQALSNQARINSDLTQREISQIDLATQLQQQMIKNQVMLMMALMQG